MLCALCPMRNACDNRYACESHVSDVYNHCSLCHKPVGWLVGGGHCGSFVLWACRRRYWTLVYLCFCQFVHFCKCVFVWFMQLCICSNVRLCIYVFVSSPHTMTLSRNIVLLFGSWKLLFRFPEENRKCIQKLKNILYIHCFQMVQLNPRKRRSSLGQSTMDHFSRQTHFCNFSRNFLQL